MKVICVSVLVLSLAAMISCQAISPSDADCITNIVRENIAEVTRECAGVNFAALGQGSLAEVETVCSKPGCVAEFKKISDGCGISSGLDLCKFS